MSQVNKYLLRTSENCHALYNRGRWYVILVTLWTKNVKFSSVRHIAYISKQYCTTTYSSGDKAVKYYSFQIIQNINITTSFLIKSNFVSHFDVVEYVHSLQCLVLELNSNMYN